MKVIYLSVCFVVSIANFCFAQSVYKQAVNEYFNGDLAKSVNLLTQAINNEEELSKSYMYRGAAQIFLGNYVAADKDLVSSFQLDSNNKDIFFYRGKLFLFQRQLDRALYFYDKAILMDRSFVKAYTDRSNVKFLFGDFLAAIKDDSIAISLTPNDAALYNQRGYSKMKLKLYEDAIKDFDMSIKLFPNQQAFTNRGLAYSLNDEFNKAIENYTKALNLIPEDGETLFLRGVSYKAIGKVEMACIDFKKSYELGYSASLEIMNELCK